MADAGDEGLSIRPFGSKDAAEMHRLAHEGLFPGHPDHSDQATPADPQGGTSGRPTPDSFWVVESEARVVGTVALLDGQDRTGRLLQLRVAPGWKKDGRISRMLVRAAVECARHRGLLKVNIEAPGFAPPPPATRSLRSSSTSDRWASSTSERTKKRDGRCLSST